MKTINLYVEGHLSLKEINEQLMFIESLPKMKRTNSNAYWYTSLHTRIIFKRNEDALAFRLRFGL